MTSESYRYAHQLWVDFIFGERVGVARLRIAAYALAPLLLGSLLSFIFGWPSQFHANLAVYYGTAGIYITTATIWYGSRANYRTYDRFLGCFDIPDEDKKRILEDTLSRYSANGRHMRTAFVVFLLAAALAVVGFFFPEAVEFMKEYTGVSTLRFIDFQTAGWYDPGLAMKAFPVTLLFALFISIPLATGYRLISRMPFLLLKTARNPVTIMPRFIKTNFAELTAFYTRVSLLWTVGAFLIAVLFRGETALVIKLFVGILLAFGVVNFVVLQCIYAIVVGKAEFVWLEKASEAVKTLCKSQTDNSVNQMDFVLKIEPYYLEYDKWVYPVHDTYVIVLAQVASLVGLQIVAALPVL